MVFHLCTDVNDGLGKRRPPSITLKSSHQIQKKQFTFPPLVHRAIMGIKRRFMPPSKFFAKQSNNPSARATLGLYHGCPLGIAHSSTDVNLIYRRVKAGLAGSVTYQTGRSQVWWKGSSESRLPFKREVLCSLGNTGLEEDTASVFPRMRRSCARGANQPAFTSSTGNTWTSQLLSTTSNLV